MPINKVTPVYGAGGEVVFSASEGSNILTATVSAITVLAIPTLIATENNARKRLLFVNNGTNTIFISPLNTLTKDTGLPIFAGGYYLDEDTTGAWYGIVAALTGDLRKQELS